MRWPRGADGPLPRWRWPGVSRFQGDLGPDRGERDRADRPQRGGARPAREWLPPSAWSPVTARNRISVPPSGARAKSRSRSAAAPPPIPTSACRISSPRTFHSSNRTSRRSPTADSSPMRRRIASAARRRTGPSRRPVAIPLAVRRAWRTSGRLRGALGGPPLIPARPRVHRGGSVAASAGHARRVRGLPIDLAFGSGRPDPAPGAQRSPG
jgi:hypothetical protein